jgi:ribulose-phosphate 3-epimerase|tara:strand:+ start:638 stop:1297 length:660 start_codon:yes stop_codon:yes gene_type:complete
MQKIKISPSILSADFSQLGIEIKRLEAAGADLIHVDVMDGHFVPNLTIGPSIIKSLRKFTKIPFDVHLMISPVHKYIKDYADAGADIITIHPEATDNLLESIKLIKSLNKKAGVSLNPKTSLDKLYPVINEIDLILIMSVNPGFGGQTFILETIDKIKALKIKLNELNLKIEIEVDGGINFENSQSIIKSGADILVSGTTIFKSNKGNIKKNIEILKSN